MKTVKRLMPVLFAWICVGSAFGQEQDKKLMDRILKPDMERASSLNGKSYESSGSVAMRQAGESKDSYAGVRDAYIKDFPFTRSFLGIKNPWFGGKVYDAKTADTFSKSVILNADREVPVRKAEAVGYYDATKPANFGSPVVPVNPYFPKGAAQGAVNKITDKINNKMTIDEVSELLNKPR